MNSANKAASDSKVESDKLNEVTKELDALKEQVYANYSIATISFIAFLHYMDNELYKDSQERLIPCNLCKISVFM